MPLNYLLMGIVTRREGVAEKSNMGNYSNIPISYSQDQKYIFCARCRFDVNITSDRIFYS